MSGVSLRPVEHADLDALSDQMRDPESVWMSAFTARDPDDRGCLRCSHGQAQEIPLHHLGAVTCDGRLAGSIASFVIGGRTEITYWIGRACRGQGIASVAVAQFLKLVPARPLYARAASDNAASLHVLHKSGFKAIGTETSAAAGRNGDIEETILRLDI